MSRRLAAKRAWLKSAKSSNCPKRSPDIHAIPSDPRLESRKSCRWRTVVGAPDNKGHGINGGIGASESDARLTVYIEVADLKATLAKAVKLGGKVVQPNTEIPGMVSLALFADVEGNVVGTRSFALRGAGLTACWKARVPWS